MSRLGKKLALSAAMVGMLTTAPQKVEAQDFATGNLLGSAISSDPAIGFMLGTVMSLNSEKSTENVVPESFDYQKSMDLLADIIFSELNDLPKQNLEDVNKNRQVITQETIDLLDRKNTNEQQLSAFYRKMEDSLRTENRDILDRHRQFFSSKIDEPYAEKFHENALKIDVYHTLHTVFDYQYLMRLGKRDNSVNELHQFCQYTKPDTLPFRLRKQVCQEGLSHIYRYLINTAGVTAANAFMREFYSDTGDQGIFRKLSLLENTQVDKNSVIKSINGNIMRSANILSEELGPIEVLKAALMEIVSSYELNRMMNRAKTAGVNLENIKATGKVWNDKGQGLEQ